MRAVSYVERLEFDFPGSVFKNAFLFGDVDNDKCEELVVGNENGDVYIYKGSASKCWRRASDLGMVTAIGVGDIFNAGRNSLVVVNGEGWCYIFDFLTDTCSDGELPMKPTHVQRIPANTKVLLLHDVNSDGMIELVIGLTDRVVRTYQWINTKLVGLNKWEFANQIGTVGINDMANRTPSLLVAHPGGTFIRLKCKPLENCEDHGKEEPRELLSKMSIDYHPLAYSHMRNPNVSTEILGNISQGISHQDENKGALYAVATLDGTLMMIRHIKFENARGNHLKKSLDLVIVTQFFKNIVSIKERIGFRAI
ncbi:KICSTOR complex protein ITFG2-like isoform X2 [Daphnia pulex]|uniref:KICSTOR complex protein ITFG2-like isoform X2 n=1 Tax=Daphnia pulex TaxID=6669 RepID=UPI001EE0994C|nr:KICSTOR complex protein ITFG2-like isoform X2 [Daphnia pulex]